MVAVTISIVEGEPDNYPQHLALDLAAPSLKAQMVPIRAVWRRLEDWITHRWGERTVEYIVEGPGEWSPRLAPTTITTVEKWTTANAWDAETLDPSPLGGYVLPGVGPYRFSGTVGTADAPPAAVAQAYERLAEYWAAHRDSYSSAGYIEESDGDYSYKRSAGWSARAIHNSGAADLLRPWRRLGRE